MKTKRVLSSLVLGAAMLTLNACDSGGPSVEDMLADIDISESISKSIEEDSRRRSAELEQTMAELEKSLEEIERISIEPINLDI